VQTKKAPAAAERQGEIPRSRTAEELALRDEVLRLQQQLEGLASKSNADTLKSVCLVLPSGHRPGPTNNRWISAEAWVPRGECKNVERCSRTPRRPPIFATRQRLVSYVSRHG
jgi:hypothetical protein